MSKKLNPSIDNLKQVVDIKINNIEELKRLLFEIDQARSDLDSLLKKLADFELEVNFSSHSKENLHHH